MKIEALQKHICDTVKEWQMKIGYREENMKLYYPSVSLKALLGLKKEADAVELKGALEQFAEAVRSNLGKIEISCDENGERYCLDIPAKGIAYIAKEVPDSVFLKRFLEVITSPGRTLDDVEACFAQTACEQGIGYRKSDRSAEGLGYVFSFTYPAGTAVCEKERDEYIYCVEADDFGLAYHRFDREDYEELAKEGHHHAGI